MNRQKPLPEFADRIEWLELGIEPPKPDEDTPDERGWSWMSISDYHNELCNDRGCLCRGDL